MHTTQLTHPRLSVLYDVFGNTPPPERTLAHLAGYRGSKPVRVGNAAEAQLQLDLHGEVIDAVCAHVDAGGELDRESRRMLQDFGRHVEKSWHLPDASLWEYRSEPEHHTHSKVLCWVALDGLLRLHQRGALPKLDVSGTARARDAIAGAVRARALRPETGSYVSVLDGEEVDSALLLLSWYGFEKPASPRMRATLREVVRQLGARNGLLYRNARLRQEGDGAFVACSFWGVECTADGAGSLEEAEAWFQALLRNTHPLGLYSEELDVVRGEALGNFPQAYSHVGLISAALALEERRRRNHRRPPETPRPSASLEEAHP
jgi:GH15 family glucan-1,4-alpha-glucosidase